MIAGRDLLGCQHGDHVDAGSADAHRKKPAPIARVQIRHLVVHDIAARLPERFSRNDLSWLITLKLEQDPAFEYVTENRSGMAMRRQPGVCGWKFDELCHRMRTLGNPGRGHAQQIGDVDVSCNQHVFDPNPDSALAVGHFCTANRGQFNLNYALTAGRYDAITWQSQLAPVCCVQVAHYDRAPWDNVVLPVDCREGAAEVMGSDE
jgi:hypothetical protein